MKPLFIVLFTVSLFYYVSAKEITANLTCPDFKSVFLGSIFYVLSSPQSSKGADFYIATRNDEDGVKFGENNWLALNSKTFEHSRKTYFIIHGFNTEHKKPWIRDLKKKILDSNNINLIIIDWSKGSKTWNYVNAVQTTYQVAQDIVKLLQGMKTEVMKLNKPGNQLWNNLYFIGHSLGAHISGQVGHLLKQKDTFFKVERITGLDPAQPCFIQADQSMKLDKSDADFVDIIHTQTGNGEGINGLGIQDSIGHLDFYVNGGVLQPECETKSIFYTELNKMICSHDLANTFYAESLVNSKSGDCKFVGHSWNGSYADALRILDETEKSNTCSECPEMGINAVNYRTKPGKYLVIVSMKKPYCELKNGDRSQLQKGFKKLNMKTMLFPTNTFNPEDMLENWFV